MLLGTDVGDATTAGIDNTCRIAGDPVVSVSEHICWLDVCTLTATSVATLIGEHGLSSRTTRSGGGNGISCRDCMCGSMETVDRG